MVIRLIPFETKHASNVGGGHRKESNTLVDQLAHCQPLPLVVEGRLDFAARDASRNTGKATPPCRLTLRSLIEESVFYAVYAVYAADEGQPLDIGKDVGFLLSTAREGHELQASTAEIACRQIK